MAFDYDTIKNWDFGTIEQRYSAKDTILYALGVGLGQDPLDTQQLRFVYEDQLQALPSMYAVLCHPGFWMRQPETGVDWVKVVHGEQRLTIHRPLPSEGILKGYSKITHIIDKGPGKGAIVVTERTIEDTEKNKLATLEQVTFCRGDGGVGKSDPGLEPLPAVPSTTPHTVVDLPIAANAAIIYRLNGDFNPLHIDPEVAQKAGFQKPILHGLASYGAAAHAIIKAYCNYDAHQLRSLHTRFSSPVYPGETLRFELWKTDNTTIQFQATVLERNVIVMSHGIATIAQ